MPASAGQRRTRRAGGRAAPRRVLAMAESTVCRKLCQRLELTNRYSLEEAARLGTRARGRQAYAARRRRQQKCVRWGGHAKGPRPKYRMQARSAALESLAFRSSVSIESEAGPKLAGGSQGTHLRHRARPPPSRRQPRSCRRHLRGDRRGLWAERSARMRGVGHGGSCVDLPLASSPHWQAAPSAP